MKRRLVVALTAATLLATGCSSQGASGGGEGVAQGVTDDTIKIGTTLPLTGGAAISGAGFEAGLEAAVEEVNSGGGINGRTLELTILDDGFEAARSVANVRRLGDEEQIFAIVSPAGSANLPGSWPYLETKGMPMFGPVLPPDPGITPVYLLGTSHVNQTRVIMDFLAEQGVEKVGIIGQDNDLGEAILEGAETQSEISGIEIVAHETTEPNSTDVSSAVLNLQRANPDAVILGTDNTQSALVVTQSKQLGWEPIFIGDSSTVTTGSLGMVDAAGDAAVGVYGSMIVELPTAESDAIEQFRAAIEQTDPSKVGDGYALQAYGTMQVFLGIVEGLGDDLTWEAFSDAAEGLDGLEVGFYPPVSFGPAPNGRTGTTGAKIAQWDGETWTVVTDEWLQPQE